MARRKKTKDIESNQNQEVKMSDSQVLESIEQEIDTARLELEKTRREIEENKSKIKEMHVREVTADEMIIVKKDVSTSSAKTALKEKIEKQKYIDNQMLTGKFINRRAPGQPAKLSYAKYEEDMPFWQTFTDGGVYTIKKGFADQIREYYNTPNYIKKEGPSDGDSAIAYVDTSNKKYDFVPVSF